MVDLSSIVPRWEWRTFADEFTVAAARLAPHLSSPSVTDEIYILSPRPDVNVKIRRDQIEIKVLRQVANGLEQWAPILVSHFPLSMCLVGAVFAAWHRAAPAPLQPSYTADEFLNDVIARERDLGIVPLNKSRRNGQFENATVELATLTIAGTTMQTIAVEKEDPDRVLSAVRSLGFAGRENLNYVKALTHWRREHAPLVALAPARSPVTTT